MEYATRMVIDLLSVILCRVNQLHRRLDVMAGTEQQLVDDLKAVKVDLDTLQTNVASIGQAQQTVIDGLKAQVADLQAKLAEGSTITQAELDGLVASADALKSQADGLVTLVTPPAAPVPDAPII